MKDIYGKITILVSSCDYYEDAWYPFFKLLSINWPECRNYNIVLNTERKKYECDFLNVKTICSGKDDTWTERLKKTVLEIDTDYILFFLEDFFIYQRVDNDLLETMFTSFTENQKLALLWFPNCSQLLPNKSNSKAFNEYFLELKKSYFSRANLSIGIWKKSFLLKMLFTNGTPWYFENCGRTMSILLSSEGKVLTVRKSYSKTIPVDNEHYGITGKKWLKKNVSLFREYKISVDFTRLGIYDSDDSFFQIHSSDTCKTVNRTELQRFMSNAKRDFKFVKRAIHIYPSLKRYCNKIDTHLQKEKIERNKN